MTTSSTDPLKHDLEETLEKAADIELVDSSKSPAGDIDGHGTDSGAYSDDVVVDEDAEAGESAVAKRLREKLKVAVEEKQQYLLGWQKDKAEFVNARRRDDETRAELLKYAGQQVIEEILPVIDSFDNAMLAKDQWIKLSPEWQKGVSGIYQQLVGALGKYEVKAFGEVGETFDPNMHHSISVVTTDAPDKDHTLAEILQKGYTFKGRVIRPALVKVFQA